MVRNGHLLHEFRQQFLAVTAHTDRFEPAIPKHI